MELITQLKQQHVEILHFFESIGSEAAKKDSKDNYLIDELKGLRDFLVEHLVLEDKMLYPPFEKSKIKEVNTLGKNFSKEMLGISKAAMAFFEKYTNMALPDLLNDAQFKKDTALLIKTVKKRVNIEEKILYPAYNKYFKK